MPPSAAQNGDCRACAPAYWDAGSHQRSFPLCRGNRNRNQSPALLRGLNFGSDGRAMSPTHTRGRQGQLYRYYVS